MPARNDICQLLGNRERGSREENLRWIPGRIPPYDFSNVESGGTLSMKPR